ncbi:hypothetical protein K450DRAFT_254996 [Umbelopsis ramanniana AG]|uniref:Uncharacterized protein n=1 Tax=Umbelopsis ramanniana AG TaxID=1314678 RepID=A0AAD5HAD7_UMBRA|nr:uncharacterized protein K450DRAFT_254996 [Umbelopsis ramanniana AG]KAI8576797.1 hypothetical protein K450DRAFT_254996 [Umbelopsis ramanniana AG]
MKVYLPLLAVAALAAVATAAEPGQCDCDDDDTGCLEDCVTSTNTCLADCGADNTCYTDCFVGWPGANNAPQNFPQQDGASTNSSSSGLPGQSVPPMATNMSGSSMMPSATWSGSMRMSPSSSMPFGMPSAGAAGNNQRWNQPMNTADKTHVKYAGAAAAVFAAGMILLA